MFIRIKNALHFMHICVIIIIAGEAVDCSLYYLIVNWQNNICVKYFRFVLYGYTAVRAAISGKIINRSMICIVCPLNGRLFFRDLSFLSTWCFPVQPTYITVHCTISSENCKNINVTRPVVFKSSFR